MHCFVADSLAGEESHRYGSCGGAVGVAVEEWRAAEALQNGAGAVRSGAATNQRPIPSEQKGQQVCTERSFTH